VALVTGARLLALPGTVHAAWSDTARGDLRPTGTGPDDGAPLGALAADLATATGSRIDRVAWTTQVHGSQVRGVWWEDPAARTGARPALWHLGEGDALVSTTPGVALCVLTADCAPLALASPEGVFAAVHAGWRGLLDGVVESAVERMRGWGATDIVGALGPCIHARCYEFSEPDLDAVAAAHGDSVRSRTVTGRPALDMPAGIATALARAGARSVDGVDVCTACGDGYFSHRARGDRGRQALVVWSGRARDGR
jgi:YfiH family protein